MIHQCMTLMRQYFCLGALHTSYLHVLANAFMNVRTFSAVCTDGIISGDFLTQEIRIDHSEATIVPRRKFQEPLTLELKNFVESIEGKAKIVVTATDATNVTKVAEAAIL